VLEIQRMSTDDGPGIRSTVFFKGCDLVCQWCHNPESISPHAQLIWHEHRCIGCHCCVDACSHGARSLDGSGARVDPERCAECYECVQACPTTAAERIGTEWEVEPLVTELTKDRAYFETSGGGITLSGGEPVLQRRFARQVLERCRQVGLHTALDTAGLCGTEPLLELAARADLVLFDVKEMDDERHQAFTGQSNERILANVRAVAAFIRAGAPGDHGPPELWIRTPLIPGATARDDNLEAIGAFIAAELGSAVTRWELCAFNNLCQQKYHRLGQQWAYADTPLLTDAELGHFAEIARHTDTPASIVHADGPTRLEDPEDADGGREGGGHAGSS
jgi:pyruvate formate lyase activating enzyme